MEGNAHMVHDSLTKQQSQAPTVERHDLPLSKGNFIPLARNGFGDPANAYAHSMAWFKGKLYAGIARYCYHANRPYNLGESFEVFPVQLREFNWDLDWRAQIWRYDPLQLAWDNIHTSPMCKGSMGFDVPKQIGFRDMAVFQGKQDNAAALYTASWGSHMGAGPFILRSTDGNIFEEAASNDRQYFGSQTLRSLEVFKDRLFTIPAGRDSGVDGAHDFQAGVVLESCDPAHGGWKPVSEPFFGDPENVMLFDMTSFNGFLYVGTMNPYTGFQIWKTDGEGPTPYRWHKVLSNGAYRGKLNEGVCSFCAFGDYLYVGSGIYAGGYDRIFDVGPGAPELIRLNKDDTWELITGEPRHTPDGLQVPISGFGPGFNNPFVGYFWRMCVHDGWLYLGTLVWSPWIPFSQKNLWPDHLKKMAEPIPFDRFLSDFGGFDLWRSRNGHKWYPITRNGFGNPFNCGVRSMVSTPHGLAVSCVNLFGPEVATKRAAGWRYEKNPRGGVEIWLGTHQPPDKAININGSASPEVMVTSPRISPPDDEKKILQEFYQESHWRHIGFWSAQTKNPAQACENIIEHLLSYIRPQITPTTQRIITQKSIMQWMQQRNGYHDKGKLQLDEEKIIIDMSSFSWITTHYLSRYYKKNNIITVVENKIEIENSRLDTMLDNMVISKFENMKIDQEIGDLVFSLEGLNHKKRIKKHFQEIYRILKTGGEMICAYIIGSDSEINTIQTQKEHLDFLNDAGFTEAKIFDMTKNCADPFRKFQQEFIGLKRLSKKYKEEKINNFITMLPNKGKPIQSYVFIWAKKGS
jgi:SAM-dependent methyltransferase